MLPEQQIERAAQILKKDGVILYPSDTVWGLGCRYDSNTGYDKLKNIKNREADQSFILLVANIDQLKMYVDEVHPRVETLLHFHERPLTLIYAKPKNLPKHCLASDGSVAIRVVKDLFCQELIEKVGGPITSTSANTKGQSTPCHFGEIKSDILSDVDFVFDYRREKEYSGIPSVIATYNKKGQLEFIRE